MIILMKMVSVGFDLDSSLLPRLPTFMEMVGYIVNPGTVIFGPWVSFSAYKKVLQPMSWVSLACWVNNVIITWNFIYICEFLKVTNTLYSNMATCFSGRFPGLTIKDLHLSTECEAFVGSNHSLHSQYDVSPPVNLFCHVGVPWFIKQVSGLF